MNRFFLLSFYILLLQLIFRAESFSQNAPPAAQSPAQDPVKNYLENSVDADNSNQVDLESLLDLQHALKKDPINLNKASRNDLESLAEIKLLTDDEVNSLLIYRATLGSFLSIYELQAVPGLDLRTIRQMLPYVTLSSQSLLSSAASWKTIFTKGEYFTIARYDQYLEPAKGYTESPDSFASAYLGSPYSVYARFRYSYGTRVSYGLTAQKDAGEEFFRGYESQGFDFYSFHFFVQDPVNMVQAVALGDYQLQFGQGLVAGTGFKITRTADVDNIVNGGRMIKPYTATNENTFFRGIATTVGKNNWSLSGFFSSKKIDGNLGQIDTLGNPFGDFVTTINSDGYHRTVNEIEQKHTVGQLIFGGNAEYQLKTLDLGITALHTHFSENIQPAPLPYNTFYFKGNELSNASFHFTWARSNFNWFGEAAISNPGGTGILSGIIISVDPKIDLTILYRHYDKDFHTLYSNAFSENSLPENEAGLYSGITFRLTPKWRFDGYSDLYHQPYVAYSLDAPASSKAYLAQLTFTPSKTVQLYARFNDEYDERNLLTGDPTALIADTRRADFRINFTSQASPTVLLRSRAEWVRFTETAQKPGKGFMAYQDVAYTHPPGNWDVTVRFSLFDVNDYDARIFVYEDNVLYAYSFNTLSNRGIRWYVLAHYRLSRGLDAYARLAQTFYDDLNAIGSGADAINSNHKTEITVEMRYIF